MTAPSPAFARTLVDALAAQGMTDAVVAPGSRSAPLALALLASPSVRLHVRIDERGAGFLALGLARASGRPVAVVCTSGTATANLHPAVVEADEAGVGLLLLTADRPPELRGAGANQAVDQVALFGRAVRWAVDVGVPEGRDGEAAYHRSVAARAWAEAAGSLGGDPGPVHVNCPLREPLVETDQSEGRVTPPAQAGLTRPGGAPGPARAVPAPAGDEPDRHVVPHPRAARSAPSTTAPAMAVQPTTGTVRLVRPVPRPAPSAPSEAAPAVGGAPGTPAPARPDPSTASWPSSAAPAAGSAASTASWPSPAAPAAGSAADAETAAPPRPRRADPAALRPQRSASTGAVAALSALVARAERGLVVAGDGAEAGAATLDLAELAGWPILAEPTSGLRTGPALSAPRALLAVGEFLEAHRPDVVLVLGRVGLARPTTALLRAARTVVVVDPRGRWLDPARTASRFVAAEPDELADRVRAQLRPRGPGRWTTAWRDADAAARRAVDAVLDESDAPAEPRIARDLSALLDEGAQLVAASSMPIRDLDLAMAPRRGLRIVANRGASGIDGFVSTAVGAALAHDGPTVALAGDLSLLHDATGLVIGRSEPRPDLPIVVLNNDGGAIFSFLEQAATPGFERLFATPHGVDLAALAAATGTGHRTLSAAGDLPRALADARTARGLQLIEVRSDRTANAALHARIGETVAAAVRALLPRS